MIPRSQRDQRLESRTDRTCAPAAPVSAARSRSRRAQERNQDASAPPQHRADSSWLRTQLSSAPTNARSLHWGSWAHVLSVGFFKPLVALKMGRIIRSGSSCRQRLSSACLVSVLAAPWVAAARVLEASSWDVLRRRTPRARSRSGGRHGARLALLSPGVPAGACLLRLWVLRGALALLARSRGLHWFELTPLSR